MPLEIIVESKYCITRTLIYYIFQFIYFNIVLRMLYFI